MTARRETILAALQTRLAATVTTIGGASVAHRRNPGTPQESTVAVDQHDGGHSVDYGSETRHALYRMRVEFDLYAADGTDLNALYAAVMACLRASSTFGTVDVDDILEASLSPFAVDATEGHPDCVGATLAVEILFATDDDDVSALT